VDCLQQTLSARMLIRMIAIKIKQNELDAKFASMLDSQHAHTQALVDIKSFFFEFLGA
jgi:hypothetical protein